MVLITNNYKTNFYIKEQKIPETWKAVAFFILMENNLENPVIFIILFFPNIVFPLHVETQLLTCD